ncbi:hypothetical protein [Bartonella gliris]|uniref:hypothetical protein n=1 Tax=Bartonella gliris TaxID=3004109 RepID=UPI00295F50BF|nr:hypothetical protein [Bartonella gliris]
MDSSWATIIVFFIVNVIMFFSGFYVFRKKIQNLSYTFHILEDSTKEMHFPDGSTIVFSDSDWDFSLDENDNLIAKSALGPSLSIKAYSNAHGFKKHFIDSLQKYTQSAHLVQ